MGFGRGHLWGWGNARPWIRGNLEGFGQRPQTEMSFGYLSGAWMWLLHSPIMAVTVEETPAVGADKVHALVQLLRSRSYEEIRQRMYDNPPGSPWWSACKIELDIRNGEQIAAALSATSHVLEKLRGSTQHFEQLAETLHESTKEVMDMLAGTKEAGRRLEIAVYVTIGITLVQLFNLIFEVFRKR